MDIDEYITKRVDEQQKTLVKKQLIIKENMSCCQLLNYCYH